MDSISSTPHQKQLSTPADEDAIVCHAYTCIHTRIYNVIYINNCKILMSIMRSIAQRESHTYTCTHTPYLTQQRPALLLLKEAVQGFIESVTTLQSHTFQLKTPDLLSSRQTAARSELGTRLHTRAHAVGCAHLIKAPTYLLRP